MTRLEDLATAYQEAKANEQAADKAHKDARDAYTHACDEHETACRRTYEAHKELLAYLEPAPVAHHDELSPEGVGVDPRA